METIPFRVEGVVLAGNRVGLLIQVVPDPEGDGYCIPQYFPNSDPRSRFGVFEDWVSSREDLLNYFQRMGWQVRWERELPVDDSRVHHR
jgi:hypothetical protein